MKELMQMGILPGIAMILVLLALAAVVVFAVWRHKVIAALLTAAILFAVIGIELLLLAALDWAVNSTSFTWGGLSQMAYDTPLYIAFAFMISAVAVCVYRLYKSRVDRAAIAPAERTVREQAGNSAH